MVPILLKSQDAHYSQFFQSPLFLNAAFTGISNANFRVSGMYRSQWKNVDVPNENYHFYFDKNNPLFLAWRKVFVPTARTLI